MFLPPHGVCKNDVVSSHKFLHASTNKCIEYNHSRKVRIFNMHAYIGQTRGAVHAEITKKHVRRSESTLNI